MPPVFHAPASAFSGRLVWLFVLLISSFVIPTASAHPSDISYLRVKLARQKVEMRFTFNLLSLTRFVPGLDADGNKQITPQELEAAREPLLRYFAEKIRAEVNGQKATLGSAQPLECVWPETSGSKAVAEVDYPVRYVDITFIQEVKPVLADLWLGFEVWEQTGPLGSIEATYEQDDLRTQVPFTQSEPDYLYDTGYAVEDIFQEPMKSAAKGDAQVSWLLPWVEALVGFIVVGSLIGFLFSRRAS